MMYFQANPTDVSTNINWTLIILLFQFDLLAGRFQEKSIVKNRTFHQKTYKQCFVGSEGVDILIADISENHEPISRADAVFVGQQLM